MKFLSLFCCFTLCCYGISSQGLIDNIERKIEAWNQEAAKAGSRDQICKKLELMARIDQALRTCLIEGVVETKMDDQEKWSFICSMINFRRTSFSKEEDGIIEKYDRKHYEELKQILSRLEEGWPVLSKFGKEADFHAWLICQHASFDRDWQSSVLIPRLEKLLEKKESNLAGLAWLKDPSLSNFAQMETLLAQQGEPWSGMIPKIEQMRQFFEIALPLQERLEKEVP